MSPILNSPSFLTQFVVLVLLSILFHETTQSSAPQKTLATLTPDHRLILNTSQLHNNLAVASYSPTFTTKGFSELFLKANSDFSPMQQAYGIGYLEGYLAAGEILPFFHNQRADWGFEPDQPYPERLATFMGDNFKWIKMMAEKNADVTGGADPYWAQVRLLLSQFDGLVNGYSKAFTEGKVDKLLTVLDLYMLNAAGDLENLIGALKVGRTMKMRLMDDLPEEEPLTDCSALIRVLLDKDTNKPVDIYAGHTTWRGFQIIWSVYKSVEMTNAQGQLRRVSYSSSPGFLSSKDDFYIVNGYAQDNTTKLVHMAVMETTNSIFNTTLYDLLTPSSVFCWMRSIIANALTSDGSSWTNTFSRYNSGTYDNQFMVLDYSLFKPGQPIQDNTLWIVEQIPGECERGDVSKFLQVYNFWPSFNIPYFKNIYDKSGYEEAKKKYGDDMDYMKCSRRRIFEREQHKVQDLTSFGAILRFNDYKNDPLSKEDPAKSIASRYDLRTPAQKPHAFGGIDSKITSFSMSSKGSARVIGGPTHDNLPPFEWTDEYKDIPHEGQPKSFDFDWMTCEVGYGA